MDTTNKFAVIYLPSEKIYSEVPVSWFNEDNTMCWWPKSCNASSFMIRGERPNKATWELHPIEIEAYCSTLESARRKAEDPSYVTSDEGLKITGRGQRKKIPIIVSSCEENVTPSPSPRSVTSRRKRSKHSRENNRSRSTSSESRKSITPPPMPPSMNRKEAKALVITEKDCENLRMVEHVEIIEEQQPIVGIVEESIDIENAPIVIAGNTTLEGLQISIDRLTRICIDMQKNLQSLQKTVKSLHFQNGNLEIDNYLNNLQEILPLKSEEELISFDSHLKEEQKKHSFVSYMKSIGGRDVKDSINRCLGLIYTNGLARNCSLHGKRGNFKLAETYAMKLFIDIMVTQHKTNVCDVQGYISEWFRLAKQRFNREEKK